MGSFSRSVARGAGRDAVRLVEKQKRREQRFVDFMSTRWREVLRKFPNHKFYAGTILPEQAMQIRRDGVKKLIAVKQDEQQPNGSWIEIRPLKEASRDEYGELYAFYVDIGMGQIQPVKVNAGFTVEAWVATPKVIVTPEDAGVKLVITPEEAAAEMGEQL